MDAKKQYDEVKMKVGISNIPEDVDDLIKSLMRHNDRLMSVTDPRHTREMTIKQMKYRKILYKDILPSICAMSLVVPPSMEIARKEISLLVKIQEGLKELGYESGEFEWDEEDEDFISEMMGEQPW